MAHPAWHFAYNADHGEKGAERGKGGQVRNGDICRLIMWSELLRVSNRETSDAGMQYCKSSSRCEDTTPSQLHPWVIGLPEACATGRQSAIGVDNFIK